MPEISHNIHYQLMDALYDFFPYLRPPALVGYCND